MSIYNLLKNKAQEMPDSVALLGRFRPELSYAELFFQIERTASSLRGCRITRGDRVAVVLPGGPESAVACFAVAAAATCAPLNSAYSADEFEFYLSDLKPSALVVPPDFALPAVAAAQKMGVPVIHLRTDPAGPAGTFDLQAGFAAEPPPPVEFAGPQDVALVLHTSGSTGRPKIVPLTHANLCASALSIASSLSLEPSDRCLNVMPLFHVHGLIGAILSSWSAGASVAAMPGLSAPSFFDWVDEFRPTWYTAVPAMHQAILTRARRIPSARGTSLRFARSCSSALAPKLMAEIEDALGIPLVEAYGMTEASHQVAINPLPPAARKAGSVGRAEGCEIAIVDGSGNLLGPEEIGEVVIRGENVTRGYEQSPEANQACVTAGWLRTGDQGRFDQDGYLFLTGRLKEIINRGGEKITPRQIDEVLEEHPAVLRAVTFALPDPRLGEEVAAAVVLKDDATASESELRAFASLRLADFKVPRKIVFVAELPKGPTGKLLRIGLAEILGLSSLEHQTAETFIEPLAGTERELAEIWRTVLAVPGVGSRDNFFALGGDSILAAQVLVRLRNKIAVDVPMYELFGNPVLGDFARVVENAPRIDAEQHPPISLVARGGLLPLSPAQQRMWFLSRIEDSSSAYSIPIALRLRGPLSAGALCRSLGRIVKRHETLRTRFVTIDGTPYQQILADAPFELPVELELGIAEDQRQARAEQVAHQETHRGWDLATDAPLRARLTRFAPEDHLLVLVLHHIASDGWSKAVLFRELEACYRAEIQGGEPDLPKLPVQYGDYAQWRLNWLNGSAADRLASHWARRLEGVPALLDLPLDRPRPARQTFSGSILRSDFSASLRDQLRDASRNESAALHMTLLAGFAALLYRHSGQEEFCVGVPAAFRIREEIEPLIGSFVNTLPIRTSVSGDLRFKDLLAHIRHNALEAHTHAEFPLERILEVVQPQRSLSYSPLFQVLFQLRNFPEIVTRLEGLQVDAVAFDSGTSQFDLSLEATETSAGLALALTYNTALFDRGTAARLLAHYQILLGALAEDFEIRVGDLPVLSDGERTQILSDWNQTAAVYPGESALVLFEREAARCPASRAASGGGHSLSYRKLNQRASEIAGHLRNLGVERGSVVGVCVERSPEMLAGLLGIWKAGAAYVPLDPCYPAQRLQFILEASGAGVLLTEQGHEGLFPQLGIPVLRMEDTHTPRNVSAVQARMETPCGPDDLAYILYTSGSTGKPKGVPIRHKSLVNFLASMRKAVEFTSADRILALTTISFDISCLELFLPLIVGAEVVVGARDLARDGAKLASQIESTKATLVQATPATWQVLVDSGWSGRPDLKIISGGEALPKPLAEKLCEHASLWNCYGPTETTVYSTVARIRKGDTRVTIGTPIDNTQTYVLDSSLQPVPVGVSGELYLGGIGLSPGYWGRPDLTAERFVPNGFSADPAACLYRTGDLVRYLTDGRIEFLRRADNQVKLRGFRIELEEVETAVQTHPGVSRAAAIILNAGSPEARLAVFYIAATAGPPSPTDLRLHLHDSLPKYMVPSVFVPVTSFPLTPSGKLDRQALTVSMGPTAISDQQAGSASSRPERPSSMPEELLIEIWEDVLGRRPVQRDDDFFALGGHSLLGARLLARVENAFGARLPLSAFFEAPTVAQMLAQLGPGARAAHSKVIPIRSTGAGTHLYVLHPSPFFRSLYLALPEPARVSAISTIAPPPKGHKLRLEQVAERQLTAIRETRPAGPLALFGWCADGILALEMAQQMRRSDGSTPLVVLVDAYAPRKWRRATGRETAWDRIYRPAAKGMYHAKHLSRMGLAKSKEYVRTYWNSTLKNRGVETIDGSNPALVRAAWEYEPAPYPGPVLLFRAKDRPGGAFADPASFWGEILPNLEVVDIPGNHVEMLKEPNVRMLAFELSRWIGWETGSGADLRKLAAAIVTEQVVTERVAADQPALAEHRAMSLASTVRRSGVFKD